MEHEQIEEHDPLIRDYSDVVQEGDWVILHFADGKQVFGQALKKSRGKTPPLKVNRRNYVTSNLIGLPYGAILELGKKTLIPLPDEEDLLPGMVLDDAQCIDQTNDNRALVDDNNSQALKKEDLIKLRQEGTHGSKIIQSLIQNSATFDSKTEFSKAKWILRKQLKYQPRCRLVSCTARTVCETMYLKDQKKIMNLREDTLGQMLSYANICAGRQVLVFETALGIVTGSLAQRMGGYGKILCLYSGQQPSCIDMLEKFNLTFSENHSIKWLHCEDVFVNKKEYPEGKDAVAEDRDILKWPCPLQDHTRKYVETMTDDKDINSFLTKRCNRFARKLTRTSPLEAHSMLLERPSDSLVIATKHDPTETLLGMLPHLGPSCPFVVFCEYMEPLAHCLLELQKNNLAINLRLTDTWMREYQVLPGRTHPNMHMSQNGGFLLMGIKLDPVFGVNEMDEKTRKEIREQMGGRRGKKKRKTPDIEQQQKKHRSD
mmetsp:Transcript_17486/g.25849  ORF Transcript_17486/g.25849 Transcript_17486/m.25849 type:complete len:487 (+) Transcript_17486:106-1566(+)|eukprot:CAMPEP_0194220002 /NCGR_PEP_ID=MMETSP0156-20130528/27269_1 /TAXON_ID=33649 /ORGANISM="Thalassionema nitzschioides, Strain L26-B" /LENGTH=486 /DNA_ID=CAMNT_0038949857 /DNA_START=79 /DNA_END=1539 /DNA_ORIENTATION=+